MPTSRGSAQKAMAGEEQARGRSAGRQQRGQATSVVFTLCCRPWEP